MGIQYVSQRNNKRKRVISDINITPFVDVLLVLLIIFMVAAPMMTSQVDVSLPKGVGDPSHEKTRPVSISIKENGTLYLEEELIKLSALSDKLLKNTNSNLDSKIHVKADTKLDYGRVMSVVKAINLAGFNHVVLVTELVH